MIGVNIVTRNMTIEQHRKGRERLREAGALEGAMRLHSYFGEDGQLQVFDVWDSQEAFDEFLTFLGPVMGELPRHLRCECRNEASSGAGVSTPPPPRWQANMTRLSGPARPVLSAELGRNRCRR